jgi:CPA2 family monovalent cation:H+ antiporter-2
VPEAIEGSLMLASHALAMVGVPMRRVIRRVQEQREARYGLLRGYFHSREEDEPDDADAERLQTLILQDTADAVGRLLADFAIYSNVFRIVAIRRDGRQISKLDANTQLQSADVLVISTTPEGMAQASQLLLKGRIT